MFAVPTGIGHVLGLDRAGASIHQTTEGACSPAVGETHANVTITIVCQGMDPKALQRLNELLDKKELELQAKIREAEEWTRKYHKPSQRLAEEGGNTARVRKAQVLLREGKPVEAGAPLDQLLESDKEVDEPAPVIVTFNDVYQPRRLW
jgi:hypothetical protein